MICLFGGTFDPIHNGHLHAARTLAEALALAQVRLLLSARPAHRGEPGASMTDRWEMLRLACADDPRLVADDTEVRRAERLGRASYTFDTLRQFRRDAPETSILWAVGSDAYQQLTNWHRWSELPALCHLLVLQRPGSLLSLTGELAEFTAARRLVVEPGRPPAELRETPAGRVAFLESAMRDISATRVRGLLASPRDDGATCRALAHLIPPAVCTYITSHGLYGVISDP